MLVPFDQWTDFRTSSENCPHSYMLAITDALNVFSGKWKLHVLGALLTGKRRFSEIEKSIQGINPRMLSKELKDLEINGIIRREENEYILTASGGKISPIIEAMIKWGLEHRIEVMGEKSK